MGDKFDIYGKEIVDKTVPIEKRIKDKYLSGNYIPKLVNNCWEFCEEIENQIEALKSKKIEPLYVLTRGYGFSSLKYAVRNTENGGLGTVIKLGDSGRFSLHYKDLPVIDISQPREEDYLKIDLINFVQVVGK